jgi:hypothetical protein
MVHQFSIQRTSGFGPSFAEVQDEPFQNDPTSYDLQLMPIFNDRTMLVTSWNKIHLNNEGWKISNSTVFLKQFSTTCKMHGTLCLLYNLINAALC